MSDTEARISIEDNLEAAIFFGAGDANFKYLVDTCDAEVIARGADILIRGEKDAVNRAVTLIKSVLEIVKSEKELTISDIEYVNELLRRGKKVNWQAVTRVPFLPRRGKAIKAKTLGQKGTSEPCWKTTLSLLLVRREPVNVPGCSNGSKSSCATGR